MFFYIHIQLILIILINDQLLINYYKIYLSTNSDFHILEHIWTEQFEAQ